MSGTTITNSGNPGQSGQSTLASTPLIQAQPDRCSGDESTDTQSSTRLATKENKAQSDLAQHSSSPQLISDTGPVTTIDVPAASMDQGRDNSSLAPTSLLDNGTAPSRSSAFPAIPSLPENERAETVALAREVMWRYGQLSAAELRTIVGSPVSPLGFL